MNQQTAKNTTSTTAKYSKRKIARAKLIAQYLTHIKKRKRKFKN